MMYLLDTHTMLWYLEDNPQLSSKVKKLIENETCFVHIISFWEIAIKISIGKLSLSYDLDQLISQVQKEAITILPISENAIKTVKELPLYHRDPFDRLLIAEALSNNYVFLSVDNQIDPYPIKRAW
ncbi:PIN domain nuclease of toxin-antitoxin system [Runella defluvii]|uniref:PIN domain nuclease of toxin-antitoxin system n=1 Tax=Runella defluvii TaxID=370973 RepID=A0A7W5ZMT7_9BACT|nr:type II toxin-antitoxin system VapC family toxin [Runella defluvii]MBB3840307.1 PIN domain nuclease of toxin-antitoxin system [Runella defluvii]